MSVQDRDGPGASLELGVVFGECLYGLPATAGHQRIQYPLMTPCQGAELFWQGKGQQEVLGRQLFFELAFEPLLALMMLAVRAVAMTAGVWHELTVVTRGALRQHQRTLGRAAALHRRQCLALARQNRLMIAREKLGFKGFDDR